MSDDEDVLIVFMQEGHCPNCGTLLQYDEPDYEEGTYEIQPLWCPTCGWEPY